MYAVVKTVNGVPTLVVGPFGAWCTAARFQQQVLDDVCPAGEVWIIVDFETPIVN